MGSPDEIVVAVAASLETRRLPKEAAVAADADTDAAYDRAGTEDVDTVAKTRHVCRLFRTSCAGR